MKFIRIASERYINVIFKNLDQSLKNLILTKFNKIKGKNEKHTKSLRGNFIKSLRKLKNITEQTIQEEFNKMPKFETEEEFKVAPEFEKIIPNISSNKEERDWLRKLVQIGRFQLEDKIKLKNMLERFNKFKGDESIGEFEDDIELSDFLSQHELEENNKNIDDFVKIEGVEIVKDDGEIQVYYITSQEGLDAIGKGARWCVLSENGQASYSPFEYYMFVVNDEPRALYHEGDQQFKNEHDGPISKSPNLIAKIKDIVRELGLSDFEGFGKVAEEVDRVQNDLLTNGSDASVSKLIANGKISYIPEELWYKYGLVMLNSLNSFDEIEFNLMNFLANFAKIHNMNDRFSTMEDYFCNKFLLRPVSTGRMRKLTPKILRTKRVLNSNIKGWINLLEKRPYLYYYVPDELKNDPRMFDITLYVLEKRTDQYYYVPDELKTDERIKEAAIKGFINYLERRPDLYYNVPDELKTDPRMFEITLYVLEKDPRRYKDVPDELKNDERIKEARIKGWINLLEKNPRLYKDVPEELKTDPRMFDITLYVLEEYPNYYEYVPDEFKTDPRMFEITLDVLEKRQVPLSRYKYMPEIPDSVKALIEQRKNNEVNEEEVTAKNWYKTYKIAKRKLITSENVLTYKRLEVHGKKIYFIMERNGQEFILFSKEDQNEDILGKAKHNKGITNHFELKELFKYFREKGVAFTREDFRIQNKTESEEEEEEEDPQLTFDDLGVKNFGEGEKPIKYISPWKI